MQAIIAASRWGLLPVALLLAAVVVARLGALLAAGSPAHERLLAGATFALGGGALAIRILAGLGALRPAIFLFILATSALGLHVTARRRALRLALPWHNALSRTTAALLAVAALALLYVAVAAYLLPIWQWDALGYHLPFVDFVLQDGSLAGVPADVPYLTTYPHVVELFFTAWRLMLPDDRLVDAAQLPFGLLGALAVSALARHEGARSQHAVAAGAAWLVVPALFLQLPTNYVDVASAAFLLAAAYFVLAPPSAMRIVAAGVGLGLFLGSKPNAPIATTLLFALLAFRVRRSPHARWLAIAAVCTLGIGAESFLVNTVRHGNPIWPVEVTMGPLKLAGTLPMRALLDSGANAPRLHGPVVLRVIRSWTTLTAPPVFDMRFGGLGPLFLVAFPAAVWHVAKRRSGALLVVAIAAVASPDPAVPRYVLAVPGLAFALAVPWLASTTLRRQAILLGGAAVAAAAALVQAAPGLVGEGPSLLAYFGMSEAERANAVGADGRPAGFLEAHRRLGPGEITLFDASFDLPYLAWPSDLSRHVGRIADAATEAEVAHLLDDAKVRLLVVGDALPAGILARRRSDTFTPLFHCKSATCTVYARH